MAVGENLATDRPQRGRRCPRGHAVEHETGERHRREAAWREGHVDHPKEGECTQDDGGLRYGDAAARAAKALRGPIAEQPADETAQHAADAAEQHDLRGLEIRVAAQLEVEREKGERVPWNPSRHALRHHDEEGRLARDIPKHASLLRKPSPLEPSRRGRRDEHPDGQSSRERDEGDGDMRELPAADPAEVHAGRPDRHHGQCDGESTRHT
mmetsp:Transcript_24963/g.72026  ORF Transcript_24963/g.72026 Transcript_24963/m.72026 type:complete len:211 (+) Transcript_24963:484-1116(+)